MAVPLVKFKQGEVERLKEIMKVNCDKITKETKELMFQLIENSDNGNEHFIKLCEDKNGNIMHSKFCVGNLCTVSVDEQKKISCPAGTIEIGNFHTHPFDRDPSVDDIVLATANTTPFLCIGKSGADKFTKKTKNLEIIDKIRCYDVIDKELLRLGERAQNLAWQGKIDKAKKEIIPMMFDRIEKIKGGREDNEVSGLLNLQCEMSRTRLHKHE
jgi:hypothetical protein